MENRAGGAGGAVGANVVAKAAPDGYTLMFTASIHIITPFLNSKIPYDAVKDFAPVSLVASGPLLVSTAPNMPANNLKELFDLVRKAPDKYTFATSSFGSAGHLAVELLKRDAGVDTLVIAYKGAGADAHRHDGRADPSDRRPDGLLAAARGVRQDQGAGGDQH